MIKNNMWVMYGKFVIYVSLTMFFVNIYSSAWGCYWLGSVKCDPTAVFHSCHSTCVEDHNPSGCNRGAFFSYYIPFCCEDTYGSDSCGPTDLFTNCVLSMQCEMSTEVCVLSDYRYCKVMDGTQYTTTIVVVDVSHDNSCD